MIYPWLLETPMAVCGLYLAVGSQDGSQWSIPGCWKHEWQSVVYLWLLDARMAVCGLSLAAESRDGSLWSISGCWKPGWQCVVYLWLLEIRMTVCADQCVMLSSQYFSSHALGVSCHQGCHAWLSCSDDLCDDHPASLGDCQPGILCVYTHTHTHTHARTHARTHPRRTLSLIHI